MTDWNKLIGIFLMFTVIGSAVRYYDYVVAEVGHDVLITLDVNGAGSSWEVSIMTKKQNMLLFDENLNTYGSNDATRIKDLKPHPNGTISFILKNVTLQDAGVVVFIKETNITNKIVVTVRPEIENITATPAVVGKSLTMTCNATSGTQPPGHPLVMSYIWQKNRQPLPSDDHVIAGNLTIQNVSLEHQGDTYRCKAREDQGYNSSWSGEITLDVQLAPLRILSPIKLHECGDTLCWTFRILAFSEPTLEKIILFRPNKASIQLYVEPTHTELKENLHEYTMKFRGPDYRGQYVFQFRNDVGVRNVTFDLFEANSQTDKQEFYLKPRPKELKETLHEYIMEFRGPDYRGKYVFQFRSDVGVRNVTFDLSKVYSDEDTPPNFVIYVAVTCSFIVIIITVSATVYCIRTYNKNTEATVTVKINDSDVSNGYLTVVHETSTEDNMAADGKACSHRTVTSPRNAGCGISQPLLPAPAPPPQDLDYESRPPLPQRYKLQQVKHADSCAWCS